MSGFTVTASILRVSLKREGLCCLSDEIFAIALLIKIKCDCDKYRNLIENTILWQLSLFPIDRSGTIS